MDWIRSKQLNEACSAAYRLLLAATFWTGLATTASAQFLCPPLEGAATGIDIPASTVTIQVFGEQSVLGGEAPVRTSMADSEGNVATVFVDICFDATKLDIAEELQSTGAPCEVKQDCPGAQPCGDDGTCQANVVTACSLAGNLADDHILIASAPEIPENPDNPRRLRLIIADASRDAVACTDSEECDEGQICPFGRCITTCTTNENCPAGNRCKALNDGSEQMVCSPLDIIGNGDLVNCTFDVAEDPDIVGSTPLTDGLLQVADDSIPEALAIPAVFIDGSINLVPCQNDEDCPEGKVCSPDGVCRFPTPTLTPSATSTGPTATRTPTATTPIGGETPTPTVTPTGGTATPTRTRTGTLGTGTPTPTVTEDVTGRTATPTRTATASPTGDGGGGGGGGCDCAIQPAQEAGWMPTLMPLLIPAAMLWGRRRRF
jgi:hypothetical protein